MMTQMTSPNPSQQPDPSKTKSKPSVLRRVLIGIGSVFLLLYGVHQIRQGASEFKGEPQIDFDAVAKQSLSGTKPFKSPDGDFALQYPASWEVSPKPNFKFHAQTLKGIVNVSVSVKPLPPNATLDAYVDATLSDFKGVGFVVKDPVERTNTTVSGSPATRLGITATPAPSMHMPEDAHLDMLIVFARGKSYIVTCTTEQKAAAKMKPAFDALMTSLQLTP
jgi:hypothetical protein